MIEIIEILILGLISHAIADFALQPEQMATGKKTLSDIERMKKTPILPDGTIYSLTWYYWLSAHGLVHAGVFYLFGFNLWLCFILALLHIITDYIKTHKVTSVHQDQGIHFLVIIIISIIQYLTMI